MGGRNFSMMWRSTTCTSAGCRRSTGSTGIWSPSCKPYWTSRFISATATGNLMSRTLLPPCATTVFRARRAAGLGAPELIKLRRYFDHPLFVEIFADNIATAAATVPKDARLVFTAHSVPVAADDRLGPKLYSRQVHYAAGLVAAAAGYTDYDLAWQSRSGPPQVPWLEPDVADHIAALTETGTTSVIVCPMGFVADHIEVGWDLDTELREQADAAGIALARAGTPNADPRFARLAADLVDELRCGRAPARVVGPNPVPGCAAGINGEQCRPPHCVADRVNSATRRAESC